MRLPGLLQQAIEDELSRFNGTSLSRASEQVTQRYKSSDYSQAALDSHSSRLAYLLVRMPAIFAANARVFSEVAPFAADLNLRSMLDLGAGPGTSMWAASETIASIEHFTLVERDPALLEIGRRLAWQNQSNAVRAAHWYQQDLASLMPSEVLPDPHDLVVLSYVVGELSPTVADQVVRIAWTNARKLLVIVEPGTPKNFSRLNAIRSQLLDSGARPLAPCPHALQCPLAAVSDWCHFSQRLERTSMHRRVKGGTLGYEDEKFSYFVASKPPVTIPSARVLRHPLKLKGHVKLTLCTPNGLEMRTVTKSQRNDYKSARATEWGDHWPSQTGSPVISA